jgi:hypothetical protein
MAVRFELGQVWSDGLQCWLADLWAETGRRAVLARWVSHEGAPQRVTLPVNVESLENGDAGWRLADEMEAARFRGAMQAICEVPDGAATRQRIREQMGDPVLEAGFRERERLISQARRPAAILEGEPEQIRTAAVLHEPAPDVATVFGEAAVAALERLRGSADDRLREARDLVIAHTREWSRLANGILELLENADARLDELLGSAFAAWRCDECGQLMPAELAAPGDALSLVRRDALAHTFDVTLVLKGEPEDPRLSYVECCRRMVRGQVHGPMRYVLCRVTADVPPEPV